MFRKTLIALIAVATFGSAPAAFAGERDGDGNLVPGVSVSQQTFGWERAYAGPRPTVSPQAAMAERLSLVH